MGKDIDPTSGRHTSRRSVVTAACALAAAFSLAPLAAHAAPAARAQQNVGAACRSVCAQAEQTVRTYAEACLGCLGRGIAGAPGACVAGTGYVDANADGVCDNAGAGVGLGAGAGAWGACRQDGQTWRQAGIGDIPRGASRGTSAGHVRGATR